MTKGKPETFMTERDSNPDRCNTRMRCVGRNVFIYELLLLLMSLMSLSMTSSGLFSTDVFVDVVVVVVVNEC